MRLGDICSEIAFNIMKEPGTVVECMRESRFPGRGKVGKFYTVFEVFCDLLSFEGNYGRPCDPKRFRIKETRE